MRNTFSQEEARQILEALEVSCDDPSFGDLTLMNLVAFVVAERVFKQQGAVKEYCDKVFAAIASLSEREMERKITKEGTLLASVVGGKAVFHEETPERLKWGWVDVGKVFDKVRDKAQEIKDRRS